MMKFVALGSRYLLCKVGEEYQLVDLDVARNGTVASSRDRRAVEAAKRLLELE